MTNLIRYNLYLNPERDRVLIDWLAGEKNASRAVRERLTRTFDDPPTKRPPVGTIDTNAVREAVIQALEEGGLTLSAVRQVVEAALSEALAGHSVADAHTPATDTQSATWLDELDGMIIE